MITTVTTSTVTTVTTAVGLGLALGVVAMVTLITFLCGKELASASIGKDGSQRFDIVDCHKALGIEFSDEAAVGDFGKYG